jgi:hypothetical protein
MSPPIEHSDSHGRARHVRRSPVEGIELTGGPGQAVGRGAREINSDELRGWVGQMGRKHAQGLAMRVYRFLFYLSSFSFIFPFSSLFPFLPF